MKQIAVGVLALVWFCVMVVGTAFLAGLVVGLAVECFLLGWEVFH